MIRLREPTRVSNTDCPRCSSPKETDTIKAYDALVNGPEDSKKLEITVPPLVAARDQAIVELKHEKLAAELATQHQHKPTIRR
jgi:hypothetical protein